MHINQIDCRLHRLDDARLEPIGLFTPRGLSRVRLERYGIDAKPDMFPLELGKAETFAIHLHRPASPAPRPAALPVV